MMPKRAGHEVACEKVQEELYLDNSTLSSVVFTAAAIFGLDITGLRKPLSIYSRLIAVISRLRNLTTQGCSSNGVYVRLSANCIQVLGKMHALTFT